MAPYARVETTVILALGTAGSFWAAQAGGLWFVLVIGLTLALLAFYRHPPRRIPKETGVLLAPADGRIMSIEPEWTSPAGDPELRICIFLSVLNVHVNRSPCAARVVEITYQPGSFLNALGTRATEENENNLVQLQPRDGLPGPIFVRQIAGALARRIVCQLQPEDRLQPGQTFGMIKLGSQTELRAPSDSRWEVAVRVGQQIRGGETILAKWNENEQRQPATS